ncbi:osteoclast-stimulating factor 1-like [Patiria miniata]|uniref:Osteoclast-stimulating factor 1 n=1 Tax=Patiria miniata TaxID=46514 RepID=A0A914BMZ6_PATMI|nr:osteoclast-stimulating factor 1-like [Patiria miniata]
MTTPARSAPPPPKPVPKPGQVKVFRSLYNYQAQHSDELTFEEGDLLYVTDMSNKDWYKARCGKKSGLIPSNYIEQSAAQIDNPLHEASKRGNVDFLKESLANLVSVNGLDKSGSTPLYWASHGGHIECVSILLGQPRVEINTQNKIGDTALHAAAWKGHPEVVKMLLDKGARTNIKNNEGKVAIDLASKDPQTAALLAPHTTRIDDEDYLDDEDSD